MPISATAMTPTQSNPYAALAGSMSSPGANLPGLNLPTGFTMPKVDPSTLSANPASINQLLAQQPQSLTNLMAPLWNQLFNTQSGALSQQYGLQAQQGMAQAVSDASRRGLTGSSIEEGGIQSALAGSNMAYQQALATLLGNVTGQFGQAAEFDIGQSNQYYQNLAQALGQEYRTNEERSMAEKGYKANMWSSGIQGLGMAALGAGAFFSDVRLKCAERRLGTWRGLPVWAYRYRQDTGLDLPGGWHTGVMAHDVPTAYDAVRVVRGYLALDYGRLFRALGVDLAFRAYLDRRLARA